PRPCWHWLKRGGTFHSATGGTFQTDTDGTNHSDIPGTFESDMGGTFNPLQSAQTKELTNHNGIWVMKGVISGSASI
ncbi:MAG: hypothetical protein IJX11_01700, partial [Bacteroidales bacterium]|nr:hypothetical protein [Bacteroidales bacterium]